LDYERNLGQDFMQAGKLRTINIADHQEEVISRSLLETQDLCLPTLNKLRNERNFIQLQERVYQKLQPHIDHLNICIMRSRTAAEGESCFAEYETRFNTLFKPTLKNILQEF
jgi:hypothetical protein